MNAGNAHAVIASIPRLSDLVQIIRYLRGVAVIARVLEEYEVATVEAEGGIAVSTAVAAADQFMKWFDHADSRGLLGHGSEVEDQRPV